MPADAMRGIAFATPAPGVAAQPASGGEAAKPQATAFEAMAASRKLIRTGQVTLEVKSYPQAAQELTRLAESLGGYVADGRSQRDDQGQERGSITLRVPARHFDELVAGAGGLGTVRSRNVTAQDVTKAYTDLETRLRVKRDTAERLREILRTRTARLSDVLEAERELERVTEEIEGLEGERRFYDQQVALSTLTVELFEPSSMVRSGAFEPIAEALGDALRILATSVAALIYAAAFLAPWLLLIWVLWRSVRAWRARRKKDAKPAA